MLTNILAELNKEVYIIYIWNKMLTTFAHIGFSGFCSFLCKVNYVFIEEEDNSSAEKFYRWGGSRWYWCRPYWNLKVAVDGGEPTRNINKKKKPDVLQAYGYQRWWYML